MLTPLDIHNKVFGRAFRGYRMDEVDAFLDEIIRDHEAFYRENNELKDTVARMTEEAAKGREISATLEKTMVLAQKVYEEEILRAKKEAEIVLWEAEKKGERIIQDAQKDVLDARQRIERLRLYEKQLYLKHKGFLEFQMELLDGYKDKEALLTEGDMERLISGAKERDLLGDTEQETEGGILPDILSIQDKDYTTEQDKPSERMTEAAEDDDAAPASEEDKGPQEFLGWIEEAENTAETGDGTGSGSGSGTGEASVYTVTSDEDEDMAGIVFSPGMRGEDALTEETAPIDAGEPAGLRSAADDGGDSEDSEDVEGAGSVEGTGSVGGTGSVEGAEAPAGSAEEEAAYPAEQAPVDADENSPFVVTEQVKSMEQVVLLAQKMEEALKVLDSIYGTEDTDD